MLLPTSPAVAMVLITANMLCWGNWPVLREACGAPMPSFALLNITAQLVTAAIFAVTLGSGAVGNADAAWHLLESIASKPDLRPLAVLAGGFLLGHSDQMGSLAMQFIPAGVAYPLYAGISTVCGTCLNAAQTGLGPNPLLLVLGLVLVLVGLSFLALGQDVGSRQSQCRDELLSTQPACDSPTIVPEKVDQVGGHPVSQQRETSARCAMLICFLGGLCGGGWSPLSTYAIHTGVEDSPISCGYVVAFIFALGQLFSYPSVALLGKFIGGTSLNESFRVLTWRRVVFGILCGVVVNSGYIMYFLASDQISPTIVYCMVNCNPMLSLGISFLQGKFRRAPRKQNLLSLASVFCYATAIVVLALAK